MESMRMLHVRENRRLWFNRSSLGIYIAFALFCLVVLVPIYWMVRSSAANPTELRQVPLVYLPTLTLKNFQTLVEQVPFFEYIRNSILFALATTAVTLVASYLAAYAFARIQFPGSGIILWILLLTMALPDVGTIVPLYRILASLQLLDKIRGLT